MSKFGRLVLSDFREERMEIACSQCDFHRVFETAKLIERFKDVALPDLLFNVAGNCERKRASGPAAECGAYFVQLARRKSPRPG
jgi:hypothetical protein